MCESEVTRRTSPPMVALLVLAAYLVLGVQALAASATPAPAPSSASVVSAVRAASVSAPQGGTITLSGSVSISPSCPAGAPVQLTSTPPAGGANLFEGGLGPQVLRDASGNFQATFAIPVSTPVGSYIIGLRCAGTVAGASETLNVTAAPHVPPSIVVSPATAHPGDQVTIAGVVPTAGTVSCPAGDAIQLTSTAPLFPPDGFGPQLPRDDSGNFRATYTVPTSTPAGRYSIGMRCGGATVGVATTLAVAAAATTTTAAPTTTTTSTSTTVAPTTTVAPKATAASSTTVPATSTTSLAARSSTKSTGSRSLRWVALGVLALVVLAAAFLLLSLRRRPR